MTVISFLTVSNLIEENSACTTSDEQGGLCVTGLNYKGADLSIHLPPRWRTTTIGEHVICGGKIYALEICIFCYMHIVSNVKLVHRCHLSTVNICNKTSVLESSYSAGSHRGRWTLSPSSPASEDD